MAVGDQLSQTLGPFVRTPSRGEMSITQGEAEISETCPGLNLAQTGLGGPASLGGTDLTD